MSELTDVFSGDGFSTVTLTKAIQKDAPTVGAIGKLGIFQEVPVPGTLVAVEENQGILGLVPTTARGGPGVPSEDSKRKMVNLKVPHLQLDDAVHADDALNVRAFGSADRMTGIGEIVARKLAIMRSSIEVTNEYLRLGALLGIVAYPAGSVDPNLNLFTVFGTAQQTKSWELDVATTLVIEQMLPETRDLIETALGGTGYSGVHVFAGRTWFRTLIGHPLVKALYNQQQAMWALSPVQQGGRMKLVIGDWTFEEYYGAVSGVTFLTTTQAIAFPLTDIYQTILAPADTVEAAGSLGQPMYARQYPAQDGKSITLEVQKNPLNICVRPRALIYLSLT